MSFTAAQYNLNGSGVTAMLMARGQRRRALIIGDSFVNENNNHRLNEAWILHSKPAGGFIGLFRGGGSAGTTPVQVGNQSPTNFTVGSLTAPTTIGSPGTSIASYSLAADCVVTTAVNHGLSDGQVLEIWNDGGSPNNLNGRRKILVTGAGGLNKFKFDPPLNTTSGYTSGTASFLAHTRNSFYPTATYDLTPVGTEERRWGAADVASGSNLVSLIPPVSQTNQNTLANSTTYPLSPQARSPRWWMDALDIKFIWHEPSLAANGCNAPSFDVYLGDLFTSTVKSGATVTSTNSNSVRTRTDRRAAITDARKILKWEMHQPVSPPFTLADNNNTRLLPLGWLLENATATQGLSVVPIGHASYRIPDWGDSLLISDACLTNFFGAIGTIDVMVLHLGHNVTTPENTDLKTTRATTVTKANLKTTIARLRSVLGNIPVLLVSPIYYDPAAVMDDTAYGWMVDAMKETCDEVAGVGLVNVYHNGGSPKAFVEDAAGMNSIAVNGTTDRHPGQNGSAWIVNLIWEQLAIADEAGRGPKQVLSLRN